MGLLHSFGHRWIGKVAANSEKLCPDFECYRHNMNER